MVSGGVFLSSAQVAQQAVSLAHQPSTFGLVGGSLGTLAQVGDLGLDLAHDATSKGAARVATP